MTILFSTTKPASPACQQPARIYFEAPDDALLARVTEKVAELMGRHLSYTFHDKVPDGVTPIVLEDVGPPATTTQPEDVVNNLHAASDESLAACRQALRDAGGDYEQALALLRTRAARRDLGRF